MKIKHEELLICLLFFVLVGCSENIHDKMFSIIEYQNKKNNCKVNFNEIINEQWTKMYIIEEYIMPSTITKAIGFKYTGEMISDGEYRIIITDDKKVLKESSFYSSQIVFDENNDSGITKILAKDTFCSTYNKSIYPNFYSLKKIN